MIKPLNKNVLLKIKSEYVVNGIYIPNTNNDLYEVLGVGAQVLEVKVGDIVIVDKTNLKGLNHNQQSFYLTCEDNILGIVEE